VRRWRILLTNDTLDRRGGADIVLRDLAIGLKSAGHAPMVYAPEFGALGAELESAGVPAVSQLSLVPHAPDLVQANQHVEAIQALLHFPNARGVFVCHHRAAYMAAPPLMRRIRRYVAVDEHCLERLTGDYALPRQLTRVIYNSVDTARFLPRAPLPPVPRRALVFSNYAAPGTYLDAVQDACAIMDLPLDVIGSAAGTSAVNPERVLGEYDLVFAKARCALEAMAVGTAVILCDFHGLGPMVSTSNVAALRQWNFGMRSLRDSPAVARILEQIRRYDATDAALVSAHIRTHASLPASLAQYLEMYDEIMSEPAVAAKPAAADLDEYVRATATRIHDLEAQLTQFRLPFRMEPLSDAACERLDVRIAASPHRMESGRAFWLDAEVENRSSTRVGSFPPYPVHLSYRWIETATGQVVVGEGLRTPLRPALAPGERATYALQVAPPDAPGTYTLRVTLVQELIRWLDESGGRGAVADTTVAVSRRSGQSIPPLATEH
jgi:hypothetical protein